MNQHLIVPTPDITKRGHPRHPSRAPYDFGLNDFDIESYIKAMY